MEIDLPEDPDIPLLGMYPKDAPPGHRGTYFTMFIAAFFVIARSRKQPSCPRTEDWIKKMWFIYTMEYYSLIKTEDILIPERKWMKQENIIQSKVTQIQKNMHVLSTV